MEHHAKKTLLRRSKIGGVRWAMMSRRNVK